MLVKFKKHWPRGTAQLCSLEEALMSGTVMTSGDIFHANQFTSESEREGQRLSESYSSRIFSRRDNAGF